MTAVLDPAVLAQISKAKVLVCKEAGRPTTCAICGAELDAHDWVVILPGGHRAQPGCAGDHGWTVT